MEDASGKAGLGVLSSFLQSLSNESLEAGEERPSGRLLDVQQINHPRREQIWGKFVI